MQAVVEDLFTRCTQADPDRILLVTDMTDTEYLVPRAVAQAKVTGAQVTVLHTLPPDPSGVAYDECSASYMVKIKRVRDLRVMLLGVARQFESEGISCDTMLRDGVVSDVVPEELSRTNANMLIMSAHGRKKLGRLQPASLPHRSRTGTAVPIFDVPLPGIELGGEPNMPTISL